MSWAGLIKEQVALGFNILEDLVKDITWTARVSPVYLDGAYTYTETPKPIGGVMSKYASKLVDGSKIQVNDQELIVQQSEVDTLGANDQFTKGGVVYAVIDFDQDPAEATWVIQLRAA